jgi:hypothetical protein
MLFFPDADQVMPHAMAFARLVIAHARFEAEIRTLQGKIARDDSFGEQSSNQWHARERPSRIVKLINNKFGDIEEAQLIADILTKAIKPTDDRNLLAHGDWWRFNPENSVLTVRRGKSQKDEPMDVYWTADEINQVAGTFDDLEADLFKLRRKFEQNWIQAKVEG